MKTKRLLAVLFSVTLIGQVTVVNPDFIATPDAFAVTVRGNEEGTGDINSDGLVDVSDLTELSLALLGDTELTSVQQKAADVDGDGTVKLPDLARLKQFISKVITSLKYEQSSDSVQPSAECRKFEFNGEKCYSYVTDLMEPDKSVYGDTKAVLIDSAEKLSEIPKRFDAGIYLETTCEERFNSAVEKVTGYKQPDDEYFKNNVLIYAWGREMNYNYDMEVDHLEFTGADELDININRFTYMAVSPAERSYGYFISVPLKAFDGTDFDSLKLTTSYETRQIEELLPDRELLPHLMGGMFEYEEYDGSFDEFSSVTKIESMDDFDKYNEMCGGKLSVFTDESNHVIPFTKSAIKSEKYNAYLVVINSKTPYIFKGTDNENNMYYISDITSDEKEKMFTSYGVVWNFADIENEPLVYSSAFVQVQKSEYNGCEILSAATRSGICNDDIGDASKILCSKEDLLHVIAANSLKSGDENVKDIYSVPAARGLMYAFKAESDYRLFRDNKIIFTRIEEGSGSIEVRFDHIETEGNEITVYYSEIIPDGALTADMEWTNIAVLVPNEVLDGIDPDSAVVKTRKTDAA